MTAPASDASLPFHRIFHPTDFSVDSHTALIHALRLAVAGKAELTMMHVDPAVAREDFEDFPRIRPILEQWSLLPPHSTKAQVAEMGVTIKKTRTTADNPAEGILNYLAKHPADLLVLSTHQREGLARWHHRPVAEPIARESHTSTLFVPAHVEGFVMNDTGRPKLRRVLVPVSAKPNPQPAIDITDRLAMALECDTLTGVLVHVGNDSTFHSIRYPFRDGWLWHTMTCHGNIVDVILGMGADFDVDLIVMTTEEHNSLLDTLRGSTMERVLRGARCPLLALPV